MTSPADRTISIPVSLATHVTIGCLIALIALASFFVYTQLPTEHAHYRGSALTLTIVASVGALSYWLWCASQCLHADVRANGAAIEEARDEARAEIRTAKAEVLARSDTTTHRLDARISALAEEVAENRRSIKELTDAFSANTAAMVAMTKAFNVLRECYLQEGTTQSRADQEAPRENW
jgi:hypothetical protein